MSIGGDAILALDVGNSRIKFGAFAAEVTGAGLPTCDASQAVLHRDPIPWKSIETWFETEAAGRIRPVAAGVNPKAMERILAEWPGDKWPRPTWIASVEKFLEVRLPEPNKVGIDRLLNAVAVNRLRAQGQRAIVIGSGTATTVDAISPEGAFLGGAILPGFDLAARSLHDHTALLPLVATAELSVPDLAPLGRDTPGAIRSGLLYGQVGAVREIIRRLSSATAAPLVVVTGGNGLLLASHLDANVRFEPDLPLRALAWMAMRS